LDDVREPLPVIGESDDEELAPKSEDDQDQYTLAALTLEHQLYSNHELIEFALATTGSEPRTFRQASLRDDASLWVGASQKEFNAMQENKVWELVPLPAGAKAIPCRWVFRIKDSGVYKARIVAKGFAQRPGFDYSETFAAVARMSTFRSVLSLVATEDWECDHMDVVSAFLYSDLEEDVYMEQPEGFVEPGKEGLVCRLKKAIYGLKQSPRAWYHHFESFLLTLGFRRIKSDHGVFIYAKDAVKVILPLYVDDLTLACNSRPALDTLKAQFSQRFKMHDLGPASHILGFEITRDRPNRRLWIGQQLHAEAMLSRFGMEDSSPVVTPMDASVTLTREQAPSTPEDVAYMATIPYLEALGSLMYLSQGTRPDISFAVGALSRFSSNPGCLHWLALQRVFRYVCGTVDYRIMYAPDSLSFTSAPLTIFTDADWGGNKDTHKSTSGYVVCMGTGAVSWSSKGQTVVALSTPEAEYYAALHCGKEAAWFRSLLTEFGRPPSGATNILSDNQGAIATGKNPAAHSRMKQIHLTMHWLRDKIEDSTLSMSYVPTDEMAADILTKGLPRAKHEGHCVRMGLQGRGLSSG